ncbi:MAG: glycosyltransferase [Deltaproteobacteria bacterium]|nr:glycosyltransferase [Deltaproteobacteria bacterium]
MRRIFYFCPDFSLPSGGTKLLYRHVFQLNRLGFHAAIVHQTKGFVLTWHGYQVPVVWLEDKPGFTTEDVLVFPEGMIDFIKATRHSGVTRVIIPLNWSYVYRCLPPGEDWTDYGVTQVITPSPVIKEFVEWSMGLPVTLIDDYIDTVRFSSQPDKKINKIAYMSRKSVVGDILRRIQERKAGPVRSYQWARLQDLNEDEYARQLIESRIYLTANSQEGANISVLEAMSAGCLVIGFAGVGGHAFMVGQGKQQNSFLVENEDLLALGRALEAVVVEMTNDKHCFDQVIRNGLATAGQFRDIDREAASLKRYFESL